MSRDKDGNDGPSKPERHDPFVIPHVTLDLSVHPYIRVGMGDYKTKKYSKTKSGELKFKHWPMAEDVQTRLLHLEPGDSFETVGKGKREHVVSKPEKAKINTVHTARFAGKASTALAALDLVSTYGELIESGLTHLEAIEALPAVYVDAFVDLGAELIDAIVDQDYVRLGVITSGASDISTPISRTIDLVGRKTGVGNIGSDIVDTVRSSIQIEPYSTSDTTDEFITKMAKNYQLVGTPTNLVKTIGTLLTDQVKEVFKNANQEKAERKGHGSHRQNARWEHENNCTAKAQSRSGKR